MSVRTWCFVDRKELGTVRATTKSEARAAFKARLGIPSKGRLPIGSEIEELGAESTRARVRLPRESA